MYMPGDESDYTITWYGSGSASAGWIGVSDSVSGRTGDFQAYQGGGSGKLAFADGNVIGLNVSADDVDLTTSLVDLGAYAAPDASWFYSQTSDGGVLADGSNAGYGAIVLEGVSYVEMGGTEYTLQTTPTAGGETDVYGDDTIVVDGAGKDLLTFQNNGYTAWYAGGGNDTADLYSGSTEIVFDEAAADYTIGNPSAGVVSVTDNVGSEGTKTIDVEAGTGELLFADGIAIGLGISTDATNYAGAGYDTFDLTGGTTQSQGPAGVANVAVFESGSSVPSGVYNMSADGYGDVEIDGQAAGYNGSAILSGIEKVELGGITYGLMTALVGDDGVTGIPLTIGAPATGTTATIVVDGPENDALTFSGTGTSYWHVGAGTDTATVAAGTVDIYFQGASAQYTVTTTSTGVSVTDSQAARDGVKTLTLTGGATTLVFTDKSENLSNPPVTLTGTSGNDTFTLTTAESALINGEAGTDTVVFSSSMALPTGAWSITENASAQAVVTGTSATGYTGTATLSSIEQLKIDGNVYALVATPIAGGSSTIGTPATGIAGTIVADGAGADTLTFSGTGTSYWHVGAGNNTATLSAGTTEIYFTGASSQYTETYNGTNLVTVKNIATSATDTITLSGGAGELVFASGSTIGLGTEATGDTVEYGGSANDTFTLGAAQSASINGGGGTDAVAFSSSKLVPTGAWSITENAAAQAVVTGTSAAGYTGTATLSGVEQLKIDGNTYALVTTPVAGGSTTITTPGTGIGGTIVADGAGADTLTFTGTGTSYWHVGAGNNTATLSAGTTEIYFTGASSQYTETYNGTNIVTVKNTATSATDAITLTGGAGELVFASGSNIALGTGATGDTVEYGGSASDTFTLGAAQSATINGGSGTDTAVFSSSTVVPTGAWSITENAPAQAIVTGTSAVGYTGTATLTSIEQLKVDGNTYALVTTPVAGGSTTIASPGTGVAGTIVTDGAGIDALAFSGTGTSYWHVGAGNDTATLSAGTTEIYFTGASSQYTETYNGISQVVVNNTATSTTETINLSGGSGELVFASGSNIGLNKSGDTTIYGGSTAATLTGTTGTDTLYAGSAADTLIGNGGSDTYKVGGGTTTETIQNGVSTSNTASGNLDLTATNASGLWLMEVGNNLVIDVLGTTRQTVVKNWFASGDAYAQTSEIVSADSLKLDTALNSLITAMATFSANNSAFNPQTTTDTTLTNSTYYGSLSATDKSSWHT